METEILEVEEIEIKSNFFCQGMIAAEYGAEEYDNPYPVRTPEAKEWQDGFEEVSNSLFNQTGIYIV